VAFISDPFFVMKNMINDFINLFFPKVCLSCHEILLKDENTICHNCLSDLPFTNFDLTKDNPVYETLSAIVPIEAATSLLFFNKEGNVQELIHQLKYQNQQEIGSLFGEILAYKIKESPFVSKIDYIIPVPLHPKKIKKRGYNQLTKFGSAMSEILKIPYNENVLTRVVNTTTQTKKTSYQRRLNVDRAFAVSPDNQYHEKHFLLLDDMMTTGATLEACTEELLKIPQAQVSVATIAFSL